MTYYKRFFANTPEQAAKYAAALRVVDRIGLDVEFRPQATYVTPEWMEILRGEDMVARDKVIESEAFKKISFDIYRNELVLLQIGMRDKAGQLYAVLFDVQAVGAQMLGDLLRPQLEREDLFVIAHNATTEYKHVKHHLGITMTNMSDTMLWERALWAGLPNVRASLAHTRLRYLPDMYNEADALEEKETTRFSFIQYGNDGFTDVQLDYAARDAVDLLLIRDKQEAELAKPENAKMPQIVQWEDQIIPAIGDIEIRGILVDDAAWTLLADEAARRCAKLYDELQWCFVAKEYKSYVEAVGEENHNLDLSLLKLIDPNSTPDSIRAFTAAGYKPIKQGREEIALTKMDGDIIVAYRRAMILKLRAKHVPEDRIEELRKPFDLLLEYKEWSQRLKMFGYNYLKDYINPITGRIHPSINQYGAVSGRLIYSDPNLQQIPSRGEEAVKYRRAFIASPGYKLVWGDLSQIEPRIMAYGSQDPNLLRVFRENLDIHIMAATSFMGADYDTMDKIKKDESHPEHDKVVASRTAAKTTGLGVNYGMGPKKLSIQTAEQDPNGIGVPAFCNLTREELNMGMRCRACARCFLALYRDSMGVALDYLDSLGEQAVTQNYVEDMAGGRRWFSPPDEQSIALKLVKERDKALHEKIVNGEVALENAIIQYQLYRDIQDQVRKQLADIRREGRNHPIQGTNARMIKIALYNIWKRIRHLGAHILLVVHDEIVCEAPEDVAPQVKEIIVTEMTNAAQYFLKGLPTPVDPRIALAWSK